MGEYKGKYPIKTREEGEFYTSTQLARKGLKPKEGSEGIEMYTNETHMSTAIYYRAEDAEPSEEAKEEILKQRREAAADRRERRKWYDENVGKWMTSYQWLNYGRVPKDSAEWVEGGEYGDLRGMGADGYYYCHEDDTYEPTKDELIRIREEQNRLYEARPMAYNGKMMQNNK